MHTTTNDAKKFIPEDKTTLFWTIASSKRMLDMLEYVELIEKRQKVQEILVVGCFQNMLNGLPRENPS